VNENNFLDQIRFRTEAAERKLLDGVRALHSTQAANGILKSGATITKTLRLFEEQFAELTDELISHLGKVVERTTLDRATLLGLTAQC
jgi:hypothetical protein